MNMSTWGIRNPVPVLALFLVLCALGAVAFMRLPVTRFPNIDVPIVTVSIAQAGASPSELVAQVTKPVEDAIASVAGVKHTTSIATDSLSTTTVEFQLETDSDRAVNDVKDAVARVRGDLPDAVSEPIVQRVDVTGLPIMTYAVSDPTRSIEDLSWFVDDVIARRLQGIAAVGRTSRLGGADREIAVELDPDRLLALGITAADVSRQLRATNIDLGGGRGDLGGQEVSIRALGGALTLEQLATTPLSLSDGRTIRLDRLGTVRDGAAEARRFAMLDGEPVVAFGILRATGASDVAAADAVREALAEVQREYPDLRLTLVEDTTVYTAGNYDSAMETLFEGALLAVIVVFLFLRDWRATLITALALPLSIIPTFFVISYLGFSLNTISLLAITLVTGILVDDAIVEIENIVRHVNMGKGAYEASEEAASEIGLTVIAISFTIVAVFAPVSFMSGIAGQYFKQFGLTVAIAVLFSLLVARLVTPMVAAYFLRGKAESREERDGFVMRAYMRVLRWTLRHRVVTLILGLGVFAGSIYSATLLPTSFIPPTDEGRVVISLELPPGGTLDDMATEAKAISRIIAERVPEARSIFVDGGSGDITKANVTVGLGPKDERERTQFAIQDEIEAALADVPDLRINFLKGNGQRDVQVVVLGDDEASVTAAATALADDARGVDGLRNVTTSAALTRPEIQITPRPELAAELGITATDFASTLRVATIGDTDANLAKFSVDGRQIPVVVRLEERVRRDLEGMANQRIPSRTGAPVPAGVVADFALAQGPSSIERYDRQNRVKIEADLDEGAVLGPVLEKIYASPTATAMPDGTSIVRAGDAEVMGEVFSSFATAMGAGILLVYVVLVLLFGSFVTPFTILASLPLSVGGAILALYVTGNAISLPVVIGFLMLMGIVTKNAIMLVEFALEAMKGGVARHDAMADAGHKRARPIVMTTIAMAAGMVPSALAFGTGGEFRAPMAIAVIGGLLVSTLLSLLFVPSVFSVLEGLRTRLRGGIVSALGITRNRPVVGAG